MRTKAYRIIGVVLMGLGFSLDGIEWYTTGSLSSMGLTAFALLFTGFALNLYLLVVGK